MKYVTNKTFILGMIVGIAVYNLVLPRVAPGLKAKLPLG